MRPSAATGPGATTTQFLVDPRLTLPQVALERDGSGNLLGWTEYGPFGSARYQGSAASGWTKHYVILATEP